MTFDGMYSVVRESESGARWEGVSEVIKGRVVEKGVWTFKDGKRTEGTIEMQFGSGEEADVLKVIQPFAEHEYLLVESEMGMVGQYECGEDMYYVWCGEPTKDGWQMRFEVEGPNKNGWQDVVYERKLS